MRKRMHFGGVHICRRTQSYGKIRSYRLDRSTCRDRVIGREPVYSDINDVVRGWGNVSRGLQKSPIQKQIHLLNWMLKIASSDLQTQIRHATQACVVRKIVP